MQFALNSKALEVLPTLVVSLHQPRSGRMQRRARQMIFEARVPTDVLVGFNRAFFGTIHSFCLKLLGSHGHHLGLPAALELGEG